MSLRVTLVLLYVLMGSNVMIQVDAEETLTLEQLTEIVKELKTTYEKLRAQLQVVSQRVTISTTELQEKKVQLRAQFMHRSKLTETRTKNLESQIETFRTELGSVSRTTAALQAQNISIYTQLSNFIAEDTNRHKKTESQIVGLEQRVTSQMSQLRKSTDDSKERLRRSVEDIRIGLDRGYSKFSAMTQQIDLLKQNMCFLATFGSRTLNVPSGVVKFDKVTSQTADDYNPNTGIFTAPRNGLYAFVLQSITSSSDREWNLYLNGKLVLRSIARFQTAFVGSSLAVPLKLRSKDEVSVVGEKIVSSYGENYSFFGGWMIKAL